MEFSEIALQKLLQLFPEISSFIVSFKDITEDAGKEESGLRIGLFILQFGQEFYYVPIIAKNETVLPIDSMFSVTENTFTPLTKSFMDKFIASSQVYLGKNSKMPKTVNANPSVQDLVTPPRTGKFAYASSSRLVEFLAIMPNMVKSAMVEKFSSDKEVYEAMHRLFGLENILGALKHTSPIKVVNKPAVEVITGGTGLDNATIKEILEKGYSLKGHQTTERVAVLANEASSLGPLYTASSIDAGRELDIVFTNGEVKSGFLPKRSAAAPRFAALFRPSNESGSQDPVFVMFADGTYAITGDMVARGEPSNGKNVLKTMFETKSPTTPRGVTNYDKIVLFSPELSMIGAFSVESVSESTFGVTIQGRSLLPGSYSEKVCINAYRNCQAIDASNRSNIFVPINTLTVVLGSEVSNRLEVNVNAALAKLELSTLTALGSAIDVGYDGIEFSVDGKPIGSEIKMIEMLVGREGIAPEKAETFIKQAKERRQLKIYLSKKADFEPGEIPQYGNVPENTKQNFGSDKDGAFNSNLKAAVGTQDPQVVESMVISELLQATDMNSLVKEYLPEINAAIDKLGRTLFLARLNMDKLSGSQNSNEILSFISNLRNVYRLLGDNVTKLERMVSGPEEAQEEAGEAK